MVKLTGFFIHTRFLCDGMMMLRNSLVFLSLFLLLFIAPMLDDLDDTVQVIVLVLI